MQIFMVTIYFTQFIKLREKNTCKCGEINHYCKREKSDHTETPTHDTLHELIRKYPLCEGFKVTLRILSFWAAVWLVTTSTICTIGSSFVVKFCDLVTFATFCKAY